MVNVSTEQREWQMYSPKLVGQHGRGKMAPRSMDIARAVLLEPDTSYKSVAKRFGVSRQRVGQIVRRLDVARRKKIDAV